MKLRQFQAGDTAQIALNPDDIPPQPLAKARDVTERLLHEFGDERVTLLDLAPGPNCRPAAAVVAKRFWWSADR
ncbi:hypothetical protein ACFQ4K_06760 [Tistrella bauzanensis]